jgi:hypothetical protein
MVDGLHTVCVLSNLVQLMVVPQGMAGRFPKRGQGRKIHLGGGPDSGPLVALAGRCGDASLIAQTESQRTYKNKIGPIPRLGLKTVRLT